MMELHPSPNSFAQTFRVQPFVIKDAQNLLEKKHYFLVICILLESWQKSTNNLLVY